MKISIKNLIVIIGLLVGVLGCRNTANPIATDPGLSLDTNGLVLWLDASDADTIVKDGSGLVSLWMDKSDNSNNAAQSTDGFKPTYLANTLNSKAVLSFDGVDDYFRVADAVSLRPAQFTLIVVAKARAYTDLYASFVNKSSDWNAWADGFGLNFQEVSFQNEFQFWVNNYAPADYQNLVQVSLGEYHLWMGSYDNVTSEFRVDGGLVASTAIAGPMTHSTRAMTIGMNYKGTTEAVLDNPLDGEISEIIMYDKALTAVERDAVEAYLSAKWGFQ